MTEAENENKNINEVKQTIIEESRKVKIPYLTYEEEDPLQISPKKQSKGKIPIFDLNQIFKINFSYNFELLKSLLESLIIIKIIIRIINKQSTRNPKRFIKYKKRK